MHSRLRLALQVGLVGFSVVLQLPSGRAQTIDCSIPPPTDPSKTFLENFLHPCYAIRVPANPGSGRQMTDPDQTYGGFFYRVNPNYELILVGEFPKSRSLSITIDDQHFSNQDSYRDSRLVPLRATDVNTFQAGVAHTEDQLYAVAIRFGGAQPANPAPGCDLGGLAFDANILDATRRHPGLSWNDDPRVPADFPRHDDGPNSGGLFTVRQYMRGEEHGRVRLAWPVVIARDLRTGCAVPALQVVATSPETLTPDHLLTKNEAIAETWVDIAQMRAHEVYRDALRTFCYTFSPPLWIRPHEYIPLPNPDAAYLLAHVHPDRLAWLINTPGFMRLRFRLPVMPAIPCEGCVLNGTEDIRYFNLSFFDSNRNTLASLGDFEIVRDSEGYATVVVGFGAARPPDVTPENGYTYVDLSAVPDFDKLALLGIRHLMASDDFACSAKAVRHQFGEDNSLGGVMGEYAPVVDVVTATTLVGPAVPLVHPDSCGQVPPEPPQVCPF